MVLLLERKRALEAFMASPQTMDAICNSLHLNSGEQVHKDLLRAIIQVTGYGKEHVKPGGLIEPRKLLADGMRCTTFDQDFQAFVDHFLITLRAGIIFFPVLLPSYKGWDNSFSEVYESFTGDDCDDCGSGDVTNDNDDIVFCDACHVGHHQSCYDIYPKPGPKDPWNCKGCQAVKQARAGISRKRKSSSTHKALPKGRHGRKSQKDSDCNVFDSPETNLNVEGTNLEAQIRPTAAHLEGEKRGSILNVPQREGISENDRRAVSQLALKLEDSSTSALSNVQEEDLASIRSMTPPKESLPKPEPRLSHAQIEGTVLLTRLKDHEIFRKVLLTNARTVDALFKECTQRWQGRFGDCIARLLYIDVDNHFVEIVKGNSADYMEFLRMIRTQWDNEAGDVVRVKIILIVAGETDEI
ncbi:hypothetical protein N431DRAFT_494705 [Stipitochalara longipes BDJ]|nr:hypothetical protein N431DRAFT_494705 [Stipitochalara longipes BDJ]